jgi:butyryl-CoA dehydrogenase
MNEFKFTEEQLMLRDMVRDFVKNEIKPRAAEIDAMNQSPKSS